MLQNRLGLNAELFSLAVSLLLSTHREGLSLTDCTSFLTRQRLKLSKAFAFDPHFAEQGFEML